MSKRIAVRKGRDRKIFSHAADKTKRINIKPVIARGGIRL